MFRDFNIVVPVTETPIIETQWLFMFQDEELDSKTAEKLLEEFSKNIDKHVSSISNPEAGECYFVFNTESQKKR